MIARVKNVGYIALLAAVLAGAAVIIPRLESRRSLELLKEQGATFDVAENGSVLWMTLPSDQTRDDTLLLLRDNPRLIHLTLKDCAITDAGLQNLGTLENLKKLDLSGTRRVHHGLQYVRGCSALRELSLGDCPWIDDHELAAVAELPDLKWLSLRGTSVSDAAVDYLSRIEHLTSVDLSDCPHITDDGVRRLIEVPSLESLSISGTSVSFAFWKQLSTERPGLRIECRVASLPAFAPLRQAGGAFYRRNGAMVTSFAIYGPVDPDALAPLGELDSLAHISICDCSIDDADVQWLSNLSALEGLDLSGTNVSDSTVEIVSRCPLTRVSLSGTAVTDRGLRHLARDSTLESLNLSNTRIRGAGFAGFTDMRNLSYVDLSGSLLNDDGAAHLARLPAITSVRLADTALTDVGLAALGEAPALVNLMVGSTAIRGEGLEGLSRATKIRFLSLDCEQLSDESLRHLVNLPSLISLNLGGSAVGDSSVWHVSRVEALTQFSISGTHLTPAIAPVLDGLPVLNELNLRGTVSDELLAALAEIRGLESLDLRRAEYNEESLAALKTERPDLRIWR